MVNTKEGAVKEHEDLFVVRARIAADLAQARMENAIHAARSQGRSGGPRAWLGRRIVAIGVLLAGDAATGATPSTGRSH